MMLQFSSVLLPACLSAVMTSTRLSGQTGGAVLGVPAGHSSTLGQGCLNPVPIQSIFKNAPTTILLVYQDQDQNQVDYQVRLMYVMLACPTHYSANYSVCTKWLNHTTFKQ